MTQTSPESHYVVVVRWEDPPTRRVYVAADEAGQRRIAVALVQADPNGTRSDLPEEQARDVLAEVGHETGGAAGFVIVFEADRLTPETADGIATPIAVAPQGEEGSGS